MLEDLQDAQIIDWFTKHDLRLTSAKAIENQFTVKPHKEFEAKSNLVEWLQEQYTDKPKERVWAYDSRWSSLFETLPGSK